MPELDLLIRGAQPLSEIGIADGKVEFSELEGLLRHVDPGHQRPKHQWWMDVRPIARLLAQPGPSGNS